MTDLERIERLEKLYNEIYHQNELLAIYIPRLTDILIKYWGKSREYRNEVEGNRMVMGKMCKQLNSLLYLDKKKPSKYTIEDVGNVGNVGEKQVNVP